MTSIGQLTTDCIKRLMPPERFYSMFLNGSLGKPTGGGWHKWNGLCPFHDDNRPGTFVINSKTGAYRCFSCGAKGGDIFDFYMEKERLGFKDAFKVLGRAAQCAK
ncbi:MAG: hypothetical protein EOM12_13405 [Verrucomicrobiae bacterium]|nr:hypothetical protein [Verrucomicrobiae bacterium]